MDARITDPSPWRHIDANGALLAQSRSERCHTRVVLVAGLDQQRLSSRRAKAMACVAKLEEM
jgi:hypothetical protein